MSAVNTNSFIVNHSNNDKDRASNRKNTPEPDFEGLKNPDNFKQEIEKGHKEWEKERKKPPKLEGDKTHPFRLIQEHLAKNYPTIRRNEITREIELNGTELSEKKLNGYFIRLNVAEKSVKKHHWETYIGSDYIKSSNPLKEYIENLNYQGSGFISNLFKSIHLDINGIPHNLAEKIIKKWIIGIVASFYGENYNSIVPILIGEKNTGKTEFFRRLLPQKLKKYFAETKLAGGKDDEAVSCENILLFVDEMDHLTKREAGEVRKFISQNYFTYRPPYAKKNIRRKRIGSICGASNETQVINDHQNNRRIIPIMIDSIDHAAYNSVKKEALFAEAYKLFKSGADWNLNNDEIQRVSQHTEHNKVVVAEEEFTLKYLQPDDNGFITSSEIAGQIRNKTGMRMSPMKIGKAMVNANFKRTSQKINGKSQKGWKAIFND